MLEQNLTSLGFTPNQIRTYTALLELGQTKVGPILQKTGLHRNIIYRSLEEFITRKLVYVINKRGVNYYAATNPEPLLVEQTKKTEVAKNVLREIKDIQKQSFSEVFILSDHQGILDLCEMVLQEKSDLYVIGGKFNIVEELGKDYDSFRERESKKNIQQFTLSHREVRQKNIDTTKDNIRFLPKNFPASPHVIWIFGQVVAHVLWEKPQTIFVIKNNTVANSYRDYFQLLWNVAPK